MPQQVVTELVIDSNTSGAADFSRAMDGAEQSANRGISSALGFNTTIAAVGVGAVAAISGLNTFLNFVAETNKGLASLQTMAKQVGLSLADFQGIKFGAAVAGLNESQINSGLEKSASLLNDASRNANSLSKELEANGLSVKNSNGQLISQNQLLGIAANLVSRAKSPGDQIAIAQMLGFTKEWIPLLEQGETAMAGLTGEAEKAGAVIDDETIQRAVDFDKEWRKSSVEFSSYMKSAMVGLLPYLDDLIEGASKFIQSLDRIKIEKAANEHLANMADPLGLPNEAALKISVTSDATKAVEEIQNAGTLWQSIVATLGYVVDVTAGKKSMFDVKSIDPTSVPGYAASQITEPSYPSASQMDAAFAKDWKQKDAAQDAAQDASDSFSKVAARDTSSASNAYDRTIASLEKHTARTVADTEAVGLGAGALAGLRAEAQLTTAAQQAGIPITDKVQDQIQDLADAANAAAAALAKAKVAADIKFNRDTGFLSSEDVQIAQQLKQIYPDVATALGSVEAQGIRVNTAMRGLSSSLESSLVSGLADITTGAKSASQGFSDMSKAIIRAIEEMIIKITIVQPLMRSLQSAFGGIGGGSNIFSSIFSGGASPEAMALAGGTAALHSGGMVGSESTFSRYVHPAYFDDAPRFHSGGIAGNEVPIIAQRGEGVFTPGQMAALGGGGRTAVNVNVINQTGVQATTETSQGPDGDITVKLKKMVEAIGTESIASGDMGRAITNKYGVKQFAGQ